ncbi:MAG: Na/Pi symporter, partial [Spirochaetes bacterium]|nr:Na/Pi symporter [Spirochaetota bacterium]
ALLQHVSGLGWLSTLICVAAGTVFTMLIRASSATLAVAIGLASKGIIDFPMAAALTLGANIGTTIDSWILSLRGNTNAKRAAWAHISFNLLGTVWVVILFRPFLQLVDLAVPGTIGTTTIGAHIAMLHTLFNMTNTLLLYPFTRQFAALISRLIKEKSDTSKPARLQYSATPLAGSPELNLIAGRKQIADMAGVTRTMFSCYCEQLPVDQKKTAFDIATFREWSDYADSMHQELGNFLLQVTQQDVSDRTRDNISIMLRLINELDNISKSCLSLGYLLQRREKKNLSLKPEELEDLVPYTLVVDKFLEFVQQHINERIDENQLTLAASMEAAIDAMRSSLRKKARKRLKKGADVKTELLFMDMIRYIEKIGDHAYAIAGALSEIH